MIQTLELSNNNVFTMVESNDTILTATDIGLTFDNPGTFNGNGSIGDNPNIDPVLDVDFFQVQLDAGDRITIDIDTPYYTYQPDTVLRLFDAAGTLVAQSNFNSNPDEFDDNYYDPYINFLANASGTYYIGVSGEDNTFYDPFIEGSGSYFSSQIGAYNIEITVIPPNILDGTTGDDPLTGTDKIDIISGLEGDDSIIALADNDRVFGGSGDDFIEAGGGDDAVNGEAGDDVIFGNYGNNTLYGGNGLDVIYGGSDSDRIYGGKGKDRLFGNDSYDRIFGEDGNDVIDGGDGYDDLYGGRGKDRISGGTGGDSIYGEAGKDAIDGGGGSDLLDGGEGNDVLVGGGFSTEFFGDFPVDTLTGGLGSDTFVLGTASQVYYDDNDPLSTGEFNYALITDFNPDRDVIQLQGSSELYSLDFYTTGVGSIEATLIYDSGVAAKGEVIAVLQGVSTDLTVTSSSFVFV